MCPVLFEIAGLKIYSYGLMIGLGIFFGVFYLHRVGKKELQLTDTMVNNLLIYLVIAGVVGGKVLLFFETPSKFIANPFLLVSGNGFVFYGSLIFCLITLIWFMRRHQLAARPMLDIIAITTCIVHMFGRVGCFLAGCCYGTVTDGPLHVVYTHPKSAAPLHCLLHPVQLYEVAGLGLLTLVLLFIKSKRTFKGQVFGVYLVLYPLVRFITEMFRGDEGRGYLFNGLLSNSQFISVLISLVGILLLIRWGKKGV